MMTDMVPSLMVGAVCAAAVAILGVLVLRSWRHRSVRVLTATLLLGTVASLVAGIAGGVTMAVWTGRGLPVLLLLTAILGAVCVVAALAGVWWLLATAVWPRQVRRREERLESQQRDLAVMMGEHLRAPLTTVTTLSGELVDGTVWRRTEVDDHQRRLHQEAARAKYSIEALYELSRINAEELGLDIGPVPLGEVAEAARTEVAELSARHGVRVMLGSDEFPVVAGSRPELCHVLVNLLRNGIRYTPSSGIIRMSSDVRDGHAVVSVADSCGGIAETDLPRVFDVAFRGEAARDSRDRDRRDTDAGGGLGLAIARGLVRAHGGEVKVINVIGGCRFDVMLPLS